MQNANHRITLRSRPTGEAAPENFAADTAPVRAPEPGEVVVESRLISIDPAMRVWISENPGYVPRVEIGEVMRAGGIGQVVESRADGLSAGDWVQGPLGWQTHPTVAAAQLQKLDLSLGSPEDWIGPLGMTGVTAYFGMREVARIRPGETVLVSGAAGAVGQMAGQIAALEACHVVGIAGGSGKTRLLFEEHGFHGAIDYKAEKDLSAAIRRTCPDGIDVFYDNVGGPILEAALDNLRIGARIVICGRISQTAAPQLHGVRNLGNFIGKRARMEGFVVFDYASRYAEARTWIAAHLKSGRLRQRLHIINGLDRAPDGLGMLFRGQNTGKLVVSLGGR
ncbi:MAG: NADP-dependent oxidoreductase [Proteobacteria bacterium]|nr:NADP-dependent oxidoreductase [Pseudomonadota bacterium]